MKKGKENKDASARECSLAIVFKAKREQSQRKNLMKAKGLEKNLEVEGFENSENLE